MTKRPLAWKGSLVRPPEPLARVFWRGSSRVLYRGGPILTMDPANRVVDALLVEGEVPRSETGPLAFPRRAA